MFYNSYMRNLLKKIVPFILIGGILSLGSGCEMLKCNRAFSQYRGKSAISSNYYYTPRSLSDKSLMSALDVNNMGLVEKYGLPEGYICLVDNVDNLNKIAGVYAGTAEIKEISGIIFIEEKEKYKPFLDNYVHLTKALESADKNGDKIVTRSEVKQLENDLVHQYLDSSS